RHIGEHGRRALAALECERVRERLQRRSRLPQRGHTIDRAAEILAEVIAAPFPREPLARFVVEHRDGDAVRAMVQEVLPLGSNDSLHLALQAGVDCRHDLTADRRGRLSYIDVLDEVLRDDVALAALEAEAFPSRDFELALGDELYGAHLRQHLLLPPDRAASVTQRVECTGPLRQRGEIRRLRRRQIFRRNAEIETAGARDAARLIAIRREVQIERKNLLLAVTA